MGSNVTDKSGKEFDRFIARGGDSLTLIDILSWRAELQGDDVAYTFLSDGKTSEFTYVTLNRRARSIAVWLRQFAKKGDRVLLLQPPGLEFIAGFWGCLHAGVIAVPAFPPHRNHGLSRLHAIVADSGASVVLTTKSLLKDLNFGLFQAADVTGLRWMATEEIAVQLADQWQVPGVCRNDIGFLQYTSGSTATPKGVMVSHGNLLENEKKIRQAFGQSSESIIVSWLPLYHDMGLIGSVLQSSYVGARCILFSPVEFLQKPIKWLEAISRYRATTSGGPNFAYDLCVRKITPAERSTLDLSSWSVAFNGAEPVRADTLDRFAKHFAPCGFRLESFRPCYGLAESTLLVSVDAHPRRPVIKVVQAEALAANRIAEVAADSEHARFLVGCGSISPDEKLMTVNPDSLSKCAPGEIGEIWLSGPSVTQGYWGQCEATAKAFSAHLSDTTEGPFLRTGDLGVLMGGDLFVTGRLKDLIIVRGRNIYPQDIERTVELSHPVLRAGCGAALSIEIDQQEHVVVVQEVDKREPAALREAIAGIRAAVADEHELQLHAVVLIERGSIPKTSSGKVQRHICKAAFASGQLAVVEKWTETSEVHENSDAQEDLTGDTPLRGQAEFEDWLKTRIARKLGLDNKHMDPNGPIARLGLDSLAVVELMHEIETGLGLVLPFSSLMQDISIAQLASELTRQQSTGSWKSQIDFSCGDETEKECRLSRGQQALWFLHQMAPDSSAYNIGAAASIPIELNVAVLRHAFQILVDRHASMRTIFPAYEGKPVREVRRQQAICFRQVDSANLSPAELDERLTEEAHRRFDLEEGPLLRVTLFSRSSADHILLLVVHHIIADLWSLSVVLGELGRLYTQHGCQSVEKLPPVKLRFSDYVRWQEKMLCSSEGERHWLFWKNELSGELPPLELPPDHIRPVMQTYLGTSHSLDLSADLTARLKDLSRIHGTTLYTVLLTAFQILLFRYTKQGSFTVGTPAAGRNFAELTDVVGLLANPIVIKAEVTENSTFIALLEQTRVRVLSALEHQDYPFALLVERLQPLRDPSRSPLFQVMFVVNKVYLSNGSDLASFVLGETGTKIELGALPLESKRLTQCVAQFDLTLRIAEIESGLKASFEYNTDLFDSNTIQRIAGHYRGLLESIVDNPQQQVTALSFLRDGERKQCLVEWNRTDTEYPLKTVQQLFEEQVEQAPASVAVACAGGQLTYEELNRKASQLAQYLRRLGVGPEVRVGVCLERSLDMVVALLGVLKAGGAYVPMDPEYPRERLLFMLEDAGLRVVVSSEELRERFGQAANALLCLDTERDRIVKESTTTPQVEVSLENPAYVIYTSGSTGKPKGVVVRHRGLTNLLWDMRARLGVSKKDRWLSVTTISFDIAGLELYLPLITGGQLWLASREDVRSSRRLQDLLEASGATVMQATPVSWQSLLEEGWSGSSELKVLCGGEAVPRKLAEELAAKCPVVWNVYGPTETTIWSSCYRLQPGNERALIGGPLANTQLYVLDEERQPVPIGVAGELYIGGAGVARGYLHRPDLTAEKFVPNPFAREGGERLYCSGDMARHKADGNIEFLGRSDHQVKVCGFRIELGEIEARLSEHPAVEQAVVVVREQSGEKRLVAYVVVRQGAACTHSELREFVKERLPEYMAPYQFVELAQMPLTPNGKVDRKALPEAGQDGCAERHIGPRTATEEILANIWSQVLRAGRVGVTDNFFELGGHSLLATQVVSRAGQIFEVELPLRALFEAPTIEALARRIEQSRGSEHGPTVSAIRAVGRAASMPLSYAQQRLWFLDQLEPGSGAYNVRGAIRLSGKLDVDALRHALEEIIHRHEVLRTHFSATDGVPEQVIEPAGMLVLKELDLSELPEQEREKKAREQMREEALQPFNLASDPLFRTTLLRLGQEKHVLLVTMHHIVSDGWSIGILVQEFGELYDAYVSKRPSRLPEVTVQYADYAVWQREWLSPELIEGQLEYWRKQLNGVPGLELTTRRARSSAASHDAAQVEFVFSKDLTSKMNELSRGEGATLFMMLLGAFQLLLHRYSGQTDIAVGMPTANRTRPEIEGLIGFFVNVLVLRTKLDPEVSFKDVLKAVRENTLQAYAHQDLPFEKLVEELDPARDMGRSPLFQVMLILQNAPLTELRLPGLQVSKEATEAGKAKFELSWSLEEREGRLFGSIEYDTDLFDEPTIAGMAQHYQRLLEGVVENPTGRVWKYSLLTPSERQQLLVEWNRTNTEYPREKCVHELFEEQAVQTPDAVAVMYQGQKLTYKDLNGWANQLANHLRKMWVGPDVRVGVCLERSLDMVVAVLGVLKAGGAYVPLDPEYPAERLQYMLRDTDAGVVLTSHRQASILSSVRISVIYLDSEWEAISRCNSRNLKHRVVPQSLAYVMYTSGSTGTPKGIGIAHQSIVRLVKGANYAKLGSEEVVLQFAPLSFDASTFEIWGTLLNGARLVMVPAGRDSLQSVGDLIKEYGITTLWLTSALFHQVAEREAESLAGVRQLLSGGDVVSPVAASRAMRQGCHVINCYGPTENTTFTCCYSVPASETLAGSLPIGKPIPNTDVYVLDGNMQPVPVGVPGELYTGGDGLARGYWNEPELTAERFIPHPYSERPGARLYKTGDLACYLPDGNVDFISRKDNQVKIRGLRIELGEIEVRLREHPAVEQAVVISREQAGEKRLVAYIVIREGIEWASNDFRSYLKQRMPDYMVPSQFFRLTQMPVTPNGKVDRKALPEPRRDSLNGKEYTAPKTATEEILANVWSEILRVERVSATDNFFELGGHSLLATQLISRIRQIFMVDLPLRTIFESPILAETAQAIIALQGLQCGAAEFPVIRRTTNIPEELLMPQLDDMSEEEMDRLIEVLSAPNSPAAD